MDLEKLEQLHSLKEKGVITKEEFEEQKKSFFRIEKTSSGEKKKSILNCCIDAFKQYGVLNGRTTRYEFGSFLFVNILLFTIAVVLDVLIDADGAIAAFYFLIALIPSLIPSIAIAVRRLHDINKGGGYILGIIILTICLVIL